MTPFRVVGPIAANTVRELLRNKLLYNLLVFAMLLIASSLFIAQLTIGQWDRIILDMGLGAAELTGCLTYRTPEAFAADRHLHLNDPGWFKPPILYGFAFANLSPRPFHACPGWMRFFPVDLSEHGPPA